MLYAGVLVILLVLAGLAIGRLVIRSNYYVAEYDGAVYIMRGVQGSFLGMPLQQPFRLACLDSRAELTIIGSDDPRGDCQVLKVGDLRESERAQVKAGLPAGSVDDAIRQLKELGHSSLLPICLPPAPPTTTTTTAPPPPGPTPSEPPREPTESVNPEVPTTVTSPAPAPTPAPSAPEPSVASPAPPSPSPTATALPPPPQEPGTNCRAAS
jgi:hypothetical protein